MKKKFNDNIYEKPLPDWIGKIFALALIIVGIGTIWYGIVDGIINQDIALRGKSGSIGNYTGVLAVVFGLVMSGVGVAFTYAGFIIFKEEKKQKEI